MKRFLFHTLRARLTLLNVTLLSVVLLTYVGWTLGFLWVYLVRQLDIKAEQQTSDLEHAITITPAGTLAIPDTAQLNFPYDVWSSSGALLYRSGQMSPQIASSSILEEPHTHSWVHLSHRTLLRTTVTPYALGDRGVFLRVGVNGSLLLHEYREIASGLALGIPGALLLVAIAGYLSAGRALRPVHEMANRAAQINAEQLNERLVIENPDDEIGLLGNAFNQALARLERSFAQLKRFTADASHELRTPLTALRSVGEVALQSTRSTETYREIIGSMLEEASRLTQLVDDLLLLSRADTGSAPLRREPVDIWDLVNESSALLGVLAEEKNQTLEITGNTGAVVKGDRIILRQAIIALIDNAIKYTPSRGKILVDLQVDAQQIVVGVRDTGPGIAKEHREKIFERFYRIDAARMRTAGGSGLGLSIVRWAAEAHAGRIDLQSAVNEGSTFHLRLPRIPERL